MQRNVFKRVNKPNISIVFLFLVLLLIPAHEVVANLVASQAVVLLGAPMGWLWMLLALSLEFGISYYTANRLMKIGRIRILSFLGFFVVANLVSSAIGLWTPVIGLISIWTIGFVGSVISESIIFFMNRKSLGVGFRDVVTFVIAGNASGYLLISAVSYFAYR